jgi:hypothetical protein
MIMLLNESSLSRVFFTVRATCIVHFGKVRTNCAHRLFALDVAEPKSLTLALFVHRYLHTFSFNDARAHIRATLNLHGVQVVNPVLVPLLDVLLGANLLKARFSVVHVLK